MSVAGSDDSRAEKGYVGIGMVSSGWLKMVRGLLDDRADRLEEVERNLKVGVDLEAGTAEFG